MRFIQAEERHDVINRKSDGSRKNGESVDHENRNVILTAIQCEYKRLIVN